MGCLPGEESGAEGKGGGGVKEKGGENPSTKSDPALTHIGDCIRYWLNNEGSNKQTFAAAAAVLATVTPEPAN